MLAAAGFPNGFATTIQYSATPTPSLPDPGKVATEIQSELLTNLGIQATLEVVPDDAYRADVDDGTLDGLHLLDRGGDLPRRRRPTSTRASRPGASPEFGPPFADIDKALAAGRASPIGAKRERPMPRPTT